MGAANIDREKQDREDIQFLVQRPEFKRFLFRVIQSSRIFQPASTDGPQGDRLNEGRRSLGLEILEMVERGQPVAHLHPVGPLLTVAQALHEEINFTPERANDEKRSSQYDRYRDAADGDDDDPSDAD